MSAPRSTPYLRCAIYTRKSSEEGLDQAFNSLHAQREACEAYIASQAGEGWRLLPSAYDDAGISGGTMDRPALVRLLGDIASGRIDIVVVYKVDRLTRSLTDFARIVEIFDRHAVSFVSVTQAFNTTSSMGRLTLNVLLSFAQFEREVTGERIRDKIAASKRKGLWMGGNLPLGYDVSGRTLVVNQPEADLVRHIFRRYIELRSAHRLVKELEAEGHRSKQRTTKAGAVIGGAVIGRGGLFHMLANRLYRGQIVHKGEAYPGEHPPIVDQTTFDRAQEMLAENRRRHASPSDGRLQSSLTGRIFDAQGEPMSPTFSYGKAGKRYRYYVSSSLQRGGRAGADTIQRTPAREVEEFARDCARRLVPTAAAEADPLHLLSRLNLREDGVTLSLSSDPSRQGEPASEMLRGVLSRLNQGERAWVGQDGLICVASPVRMVFRGGRSRLEAPPGARSHARARPNRPLIDALRQAHRLTREAHVSPALPVKALGEAKGVDDPHRRKLARLAFLAPDIQRAILVGRQPANLNLQMLMLAEIPASWSDQRRHWGFEVSATQVKA